MTRPSEDHPNLQGLRVALQQSPAAAGLPCPRYATAGSSGVDLIACNEEAITLRRGEVTLVPTGISIALPSGFEAQVRARSGLALKHGVALVNAPGTIDADYRGEIGVIATVLVNEPFRVERGMRIAQLVIAPVTRVSFEPVKNLEVTERGAGGFGHTGTETEGAAG